MRDALRIALSVRALDLSDDKTVCACAAVCADGAAVVDGLEGGRRALRVRRGLAPWRVDTSAGDDAGDGTRRRMLKTVDAAAKLCLAHALSVAMETPQELEMNNAYFAKTGQSPNWTPCPVHGRYEDARANSRVGPDGKVLPEIVVRCDPKVCSLRACAVDGCDARLCAAHGDGIGRWCWRPSFGWVAFKGPRCAAEGCGVMMCAAHRGNSDAALRKCDLCEGPTQQTRDGIRGRRGEKRRDWVLLQRLEFCPQHLTKCRGARWRVASGLAAPDDDDLGDLDACGLTLCRACLLNHTCGDENYDSDDASSTSGEDSGSYASLARHEQALDYDYDYDQDKYFAYEYDDMLPGGWEQRLPEEPIQYWDPAEMFESEEERTDEGTT